MADHSLRSFVGKVRRFWLTNFRPRYVKEQLARREGACKNCGRCCKLTFRCLFLNKENRCSVYGIWRPANCTAFPIDERDLGDVDCECGFSFRPKAAAAEEAQSPESTTTT